MSQDTPSLSSSHEEAMLLWVQQFAPYGVITTDLELRVRTWNRWMENHSGFNAGSIVGRQLLDIFPDLAERRLVARFKRALEGEVSILSTALHGYIVPLPSLLKESGFSLMQQTARVGPLQFDTAIVGTIVVIEDVTHREFQAANLRRQLERDRVLSWALAHLLKSKLPRRAVRDLFFKVAEFFDFDSYFLYLSQPNGEIQLHSAGGVAPKDEENFHHSKAFDSSWIPTPQMSGAIVFQHLDSSDDIKAVSLRHLGLKAYIALPLAVGNRSLGALCFGTRSRSTIDQSETELLSTIAQYFSIALDRETTDLQLQEAQTRLREHAQSLEQQVAERTFRLTEIIAELETFSYSLAHDLRAPIRALVGYCQVLIEDYSSIIPEEPRELVVRLSRSCNKLDALTRDLLAFSKVSREEIKLSEIDTAGLISEILALYPVRWRDSVIIREPLAHVIAHKGLLRMCLSNLIENAHKFVRPKEEPKIRVWTEVVSQTGAVQPASALPFSSAVFTAAAKPAPSDQPPDNRQCVRIWIEDRGIGIAPQEHEKIFGIFERSSHAGVYEGTGIGLAIVARAMQRMGGRCGVESSLGVGSRFWLELAPAVPK